MQSLLSRIFRRKPQPGAGASSPLRPVPAARKDPVQDAAPSGESWFSHSPWYSPPGPATDTEPVRCDSSTYSGDSSSSCDSGSDSGSGSSSSSDD